MFANVPVAVTLALPSKLTFQDKSPVIAMFLAFANLVAVSAFPINCPLKVLEYTSFHLNEGLPKSVTPLVAGVIPLPTLPLNVIVSAEASPKITLLLKVAISVTTNLSSIVVVPPAESIVKLPVVVSISLSPVIPI